jgi:hypothetical protein
MRKPRLVHGPSLTWFLIFGNSLSSEPFPFGHPQSKTGSLQAVRAAVDRRAGALPRASTPFQRPKTDVPARCSEGPPPPSSSLSFRSVTWITADAAAWR